MSVDKSHLSGFDSRAYRNALGSFGTGVCLVAADDSEGRARAITVNSFASVSLAPPIVLWSIDVQSDRFHMFTETSLFSVNILKAGEEDISRYFAKNEEAELSDEQLVRGVEGVPAYAGALTRFYCRTSWRQKAGDHVVIFGSVLDFQCEDGDALGFFRGKYVTHGLEGN